jgi:hypothetical protein
VKDSVVAVLLKYGHDCPIRNCLELLPPPLWSSGQFLATDPEARVQFPALPGKKKGMGLQRGPLSLVSTTEELLDRKVVAPV